jgi:hypothetical protein
LAELDIILAAFGMADANPALRISACSKHLDTCSKQGRASAIAGRGNGGNPAKSLALGVLTDREQIQAELCMVNAIGAGKQLKAAASY